MPFHLNKVECPSCQVWLKLAQWFWRRFLKINNVFTLNLSLLTLRYKKKCCGPSPKDALCRVWLKLVQWFWRRLRVWSIQCRFIWIRVDVLLLGPLALETEMKTDKRTTGGPKSSLEMSAQFYTQG